MSLNGSRPTAPLIQPPPIDGVRRRYVDARGVRFHLSEGGDPAGLPVLALHGWPQHHYAWRDLLGDPPAGMRILAPDLPGYGWSGPAPHRWVKEDVVSDLLALLDHLEIDRVLLAGHDWGGYLGHLLALRAPERLWGYLALNIVHPWNTSATLLPHLWRFLPYQPGVATVGGAVMRRTRLIELSLVLSLADRNAMPRETVRWFSERFRDPVCARAGVSTYRTFWLKELPKLAIAPERRRSTVPTRALFGKGDWAVHHSLAAAETAIADDYQLELVSGCGHFIVDERPVLVRTRLVELGRQVAPL